MKKHIWKILQQNLFDMNTIVRYLSDMDANSAIYVAKKSMSYDEKM